jgi:hypothetical protein
MQLLLTASSSQQELSPPLFDNLFDTYDGGGSEIFVHKIIFFRRKSYFVSMWVAVSHYFFLSKVSRKGLFLEVNHPHPYPNNLIFIN